MNVRFCILLSSLLFHFIVYLYLNVYLCLYDNSLNMWEFWIKQFDQINQGLRISWGVFCTISFSISFGTEMSLISVSHELWIPEFVFVFHVKLEIFFFLQFIDNIIASFMKL